MVFLAVKRVILGRAATGTATVLHVVNIGIAKMGHGISGSLIVALGYIQLPLRALLAQHALGCTALAPGATGERAVRTVVAGRGIDSTRILQRHHVEGKLVQLQTEPAKKKPAI